jgi:CheY-like chemotaxis protein
MHFALPHCVNKPIVLIVDDEAAIRMLVAVHCQRGGYGTMLAGDGQQAFGITQTTSFDLIITDYQMPVMNGVEFCRRLRSDEGNSNQHTPIIISTANLSRLDTFALDQELRPIRFSGKPLKYFEFSESQ